MIEAWESPARDAGSCNFCNDQVNEHGTAYFARVIVVRGNGMVVRFCPNCLESLHLATRYLPKS